MVVDVSVEIAVFVRAMGIPVVVIAMPGDRTDRAHRLAYDAATALIATWPAAARDEGWPDTWHRKTLHTGAFSRYDNRPRLPVPSGSRRNVVFIGGCGGIDVTHQQVREAVSATSGWEWELIGVPGGKWVDDPWPILCRADVIVTHAGQNTVAETAAARRPAIVIPQRRPHDEQTATACQLRVGGYATVVDTWPDADRWPTLLLDAAARRDRWGEWAPGDGALRAARCIEELVGSLSDVA
jgi:UDP-N-acetylglucosamine:LPS N-acetylglucosamine transferase